MTVDIGGMGRSRVLTLSERLRANLNRALARYRCAGGPLLTITTLAPLAGSTRWTLAGLGGHTRISTLQGIAGALGCTVADLVADVEPVTPVEPDRLWIPHPGAQPQDEPTAPAKDYEVVVTGAEVEDWPADRS